MLRSHPLPLLFVLSALACSSAPGGDSAYSDDPNNTFANGGSAGSNTGGSGSGKGDHPAGSGGTAVFGTGGDTTGNSAETCNDGLDNNDDGRVDEDCACEAAATQSCYPGPASTRNVGACSDGTQHCDVSGEFTQWSDCSGAVTPVAEECNDDVDNDCDGLVDCEDEADCDTCAMQCTVTHGYDVAFVETVDGAGLLEPCGDGCADLWVGQIGDNYWSGTCAIYEQDVTINVLSPTAIHSAILERAKWDDYMQILLNGAMVWTGPNGNFPPETGGDCELSTSWDTYPGTDLTSYFAIAGAMHFRIRVSVTGGGEGYARIRLLYDPELLITDHGWTPDECVAAAQSIANGECNGTVTCTDGPDASGCVSVNGLTVCESDVTGTISSPIAGISPLCRNVFVDLTGCP